jgi:hypothetical protein
MSNNVKINLIYTFFTVKYSFAVQPLSFDLFPPVAQPRI